MDRLLEPNEEERILKNMVQCIMDDLDNFYFDELIMKKYQKELFQFFTKISKEHSLFSTRFDFSDKKNIEKSTKPIKSSTTSFNIFLYSGIFVKFLLSTSKYCHTSL